MFGTLVAALYGNFEDKNEIKKFGLLAVILGLIIGVYWVLRILKDSVFFKIVGPQCQPIAKIASVFMMIPLIFLYSKLVDKYSRHKIFYLLSAFYGIASLVFAYFLMDPTMGLANTVESPYRILGWAWYIFVESFGSIMVVLFWSFASDITTPESAKRGFPLIGIGAQFGGVLCTVFLRNPVKLYGAPVVIAISSLLIFTIALVVRYFVGNIPKEHLIGFKSKEPSRVKTGFLDGIRLMFSNPYLLGIFGVVSFYQIVNAILDFQFKCMANSAFVDHNAFGAYLFDASIVINIISVLCLIFGINSIGRKFGLTVSLVLLPVSIACVVFVFKMNLTLTVAFWAIVISKSINYALNQPTKEQLYIPTTKSAKYKTKAWIDAFGSRASKSIGSGVNLLQPVLGPSIFILFSTGLSFVLIGAWIFVGIFLGASHSSAVKSNKAIC